MASQDRIPSELRDTASSAQLYSFHRSLKGPPTGTFRSPAAKDLACLLELDPNVIAWIAAAPVLQAGAGEHAPDFDVLHADGVRWLLDAPDRAPVASITALEAAARAARYQYRPVTKAEVYDGFRLRNARDLLRYCGHNVPLGDRVRILAALDENGSLALADCLGIVRETHAVAAVASLILQGLLEVELDDALIGPETQVRRIRN